MTSNYHIQRSIEIQKAAKTLGIIKPVMARVANKINKQYPHHTISMMTEDIDNLFNDMKTEYNKPEYDNDMTIDITTWTSDEIASSLIDLWEVIY